MTAETVWGVPRQKTITWYDPLAAAEKGAAMAGIDHLRAMLDGLLPPPPIAAHFGLQVVSVEPGEVTFTCMPDESAYNPIGLVHGGLVCTLLDSVTGCAVQSTLPAGFGYTSVEIRSTICARCTPAAANCTPGAGSPSPGAGSHSPRATSVASTAR
jgi:hypothetical protein